jgi:hypothetical protein
MKLSCRTTAASCGKWHARAISQAASSTCQNSCKLLEAARRRRVLVLTLSRTLALLRSPRQQSEPEPEPEVASERLISGVLLRLHLLRSESMSTSHFSLSLLSKLVGSLASYEANGWPFYFRTIPSKVLPPILLPKPPLLRLSERLSFFSSGIADDPKEDADDPR